MENENYFTRDELIEMLSLYRKIMNETSDQLTADDRKNAKEMFRAVVNKREADWRENSLSGKRNDEVLNPIVKDLNTIYMTVSEIGRGKATVLSVFAYDALTNGVIKEEEIEQKYGKDVAVIVRGLVKANELYQKNVAVETENFRKLLLTFAEDIRVVFILIAEHVYIMRNLEKFDEEHQQKIARESAYLYAPMAHRMGLYKLKTELEDLSLRWISPEIYFDIEHKLKETKDARNKHIADFIAPLKKQLEDAGLDFELK